MSAGLKLNSVNQIIKDTEIYSKGSKISSIALVVKGRIRISAEGVNIIVGSGNFLGICELEAGEYSVTYTAESNSVVYAFPVMEFKQAVTALIKVNKDYAALMFSTFGKYIRELSRNYEDMLAMADRIYNFTRKADKRYLEIAADVGINTRNTGISITAQTYGDREENIIDKDKVLYYRTCCSVPLDVQKAFFNVNPVIPIYNIVEQVSLVNLLLGQCRTSSAYLVKLAGSLIMDDNSLYMDVIRLAKAIKEKDSGMGEIISLLDDVIDNANSLENLLSDKSGIDLGIDHEYMESTYFSLINTKSAPVTDKAGREETEAEAGKPEDIQVDLSVLDGAFGFITRFSGIDEVQAEVLKEYLSRFSRLPDKMSTEDNVREIRRNITNIYYNLYKLVFIKDYNSEEETPLIIDLFLKYGFISEKLVSDKIKQELLLVPRDSKSGRSCAVYDMKEWLTEIYEGRKEPSRSEFDLDYYENLREMRKTGRITAEKEKELLKDKEAKLDYEINNMFKTNHRLIYGQVSVFVPFLYTEGCPGSLERYFLSKDRVNAALKKLLSIDFSVFYRERLFVEEDKFNKEYIMEEVFPDFISFPTFGSNGVMWQEISGRKRNSKGRFLVPAFLDTDIDSIMIKLAGRFRWELCRTIQGASWNDIQIKSLTSEYSDFVQFYRKNRLLSDEKKEKLKLQIQKCRNNTREVFVIDYENWIKHESKGGLCLSKPVREILATYCPFSKEIRERSEKQPLMREAMARFTRGRVKKTREYDIKFRKWNKDRIEVPQEITDTRNFYLEG